MGIIMQIIKFRVGDVIELKKPHPCGSRQFRVIRVGGEMRIICLGCSHDTTVERVKLEKATKRVVSSASENDSGDN